MESRFCYRLRPDPRLRDLRCQTVQPWRVAAHVAHPASVLRIRFPRRCMASVRSRELLLQPQDLLDRFPHTGTLLPITRMFATLDAGPASPRGGDANRQLQYPEGTPIGIADSRHLVDLGQRSASDPVSCQKTAFGIHTTSPTRPSCDDNRTLVRLGLERRLLHFYSKGVNRDPFHSWAWALLPLALLAGLARCLRRPGSPRPHLPGVAVPQTSPGQAHRCGSLDPWCCTSSAPHGRQA